MADRLASAERALPPTNLHDGYHVYRWTKDWTSADADAYAEAHGLADGDIMGSEVSPGFGRPGRGTRYKLPGIFRTDGTHAMNVQWLLSNGFLKEVE